MTDSTWESIKTIIATMQLASNTENFNLMASMNYELFQIIKEVRENEKKNEKK